MALVPTTLGEMDESLLEKRTGGHDSPTESASWVEYWHGGVMVHRSASVTVKPDAASGATGEFK